MFQEEVNLLSPVFEKNKPIRVSNPSVRTEINPMAYAARRYVL